MKDILLKLFLLHFCSARGSETLDTYLPEPAAAIAATDLLDFSTLLLHNNEYQIPKDIDNAVVAALLNENLYSFSGVFSSGGTQVEIEMDRNQRNMSMSLHWVPPTPLDLSSISPPSDRKCHQYIQAAGTLIVESVVFRDVSESLSASLCEFCARANYAMRVGGFLFNPEEKTVVFRSSLPMGSSLPFSEQVALIRKLVSINIETHKQYLPGLQSLIEAGMSARESVAAVEGGLMDFLTGAM